MFFFLMIYNNKTVVLIADMVSKDDSNMAESHSVVS